jgi:hypothetical protein
MQRICKFGENKSVRSKTSKLFIRRPLKKLILGLGVKKSIKKNIAKALDSLVSYLSKTEQD